MTLIPNCTWKPRLPRKIERLKAKIDEIELECRKGNAGIIHMKNAVETTLNALGDIFE